MPFYRWDCLDKVFALQPPWPELCDRHNSPASASPHTRARPRCSVSTGGVIEDVIALPSGELFSETNDNSVAILLTYGARAAGRRRRGERGVGGQRPLHEVLTLIRVQKYKQS